MNGKSPTDVGVGRARQMPGASEPVQAAPDPVDKAIAGAERQLAVAQRMFPLNRPDGQSAFGFILPADLRESDMLAILEGLTIMAREVSLIAEQNRHGGLVLAKGPLPPRG